MDKPSLVLVPLPTSSRTMKLSFVANFNISFTSFISTIKVELPLDISSEAPILVNILSTIGSFASLAGTKLPI